MRGLLFVIALCVSVSTYAADLPLGQRLAEIKSITTNGQFPVTKIEIVYVRGCSERFVDTLTRSQIAAGKNYLEVGALVEETNKTCQMNGLPFLEETVSFQLYSELPLILLELDLSMDLRAPIKPSGTSVGNF